MNDVKGARGVRVQGGDRSIRLLGLVELLGMGIGGTQDIRIIRIIGVLWL